MLGPERVRGVFRRGGVTGGRHGRPVRWAAGVRITSVVPEHRALMPPWAMCAAQGAGHRVTVAESVCAMDRVFAGIVPASQVAFGGQAGRCC